jgi:hypothetical protein
MEAVGGPDLHTNYRIYDISYGFDIVKWERKGKAGSILAQCPGYVPKRPSQERVKLTVAA